MYSVCRRVSSLAVAFLVVVASALFAQQAWAADIVAGKIGQSNWFDENGYATYVPSYDSPDGNAHTDYSYQEDTSTVAVSHVTSGKVDYDPATNTLSLTNVQGGEVCNSLGPIVFHGACSVSDIDGSNAEADVTVASDASVSIEKATTNVRNLNVSGGTLSAPLVWCSGSVTVTDGAVYAPLHCRGAFTMSGGAVYAPVECYGDFSMSGGVISFANQQYGLSINGSKMTMTGGSIDITAPLYHGVEVLSGDLVMSGGTISIKKAHNTPISVDGNITVDGGSIVATLISNMAYDYAISAKSMANDPGVLKSIRGVLPKGASFKSGGNQYKVELPNTAILAKYGSKKKSVKFNEVKFGGSSYTVDGVGDRAFDTSAGHKVKAVEFKNFINSIGSKAFANTKALTTLKIFDLNTVRKFSSRGYLKSLRVSKSSNYSKKAFAKCGKAGGKKLTVKFERYTSVDERDSKTYKKLLKKYGLPSGVTVKA